MAIMSAAHSSSLSRAARQAEARVPEREDPLARLLPVRGVVAAATR